jgi:tripartite-type tricarboxylate transporter receptor subunit TctC
MKLKAAIALAALLAAATAQGATPEETKANLDRLKPKDFPTQPIELIVVYPAGGGMDQTARILAKHAEKVTGQRFIVTNKTGGAGVIGHTYLITQAKNDGYTVGVVASTLWADSALRSNGKWSYRDLDALGFINYDPYTWVVAADGPLKGKSLKDVIALAKEKPGTLRMSVLPGNTAEFLSLQVEQITGAKFVRVPFQGGAPGVTAALGGHVEIAAAFFAEYRGHADAGTVKAIGVAGPERSPNLPDAPTFNEAIGSDKILWTAWRYAAAPKGIPADRRTWLVAAINAALDEPELQEEYKKTGAVMDRRIATPEQTAAQADKLANIENGFYVQQPAKQ